MTDEETVQSAEESRKIWLADADKQIRMSNSIIHAEQLKKEPLVKKTKEFRLADFCSWSIRTYPQVHFLSLNLFYRDIEVHGIYDESQEEIDDPDEKIADSIMDYLNENYYRHDFRDFDWQIVDIEMLDLYSISQWRP